MQTSVKKEAGGGGKTKCVSDYSLEKLTKLLPTSRRTIFTGDGEISETRDGALDTGQLWRTHEREQGRQSILLHNSDLRVFVVNHGHERHKKSTWFVGFVARLPVGVRYSVRVLFRGVHRLAGLGLGGGLTEDAGAELGDDINGRAGVGMVQEKGPADEKKQGGP